MKTLIVEDQALFRDLLGKVCEMYFHFEKVTACGTGREAAEHLARESYDLVILDIELPDEDGFLWAERWRAQPGAPKILALSAYCDDFMIYRVIHSDLHGFLDKAEQSVESLRLAIETVLAGRLHFAEVVRRVQRALRDDPFAFPKLLSEKEITVLGLIGAGLDNEAIGQRLGITPATAQWHRKLIMRKLNLHSATELVVYAAEKGFSRLGGPRGSGAARG